MSVRRDIMKIRYLNVKLVFSTVRVVFKPMIIVLNVATRIHVNVNLTCIELKSVKCVCVSLAIIR